MFIMDSRDQWRRSVIKHGGRGQSGQGITLFQVPRKVSFTSYLWHESVILDDVKLAELSNNSFEWKNVTFLGVKAYSDPSYIFSGGQDLQYPRTYAPVIQFRPTRLLDRGRNSFLFNLAER